MKLKPLLFFLWVIGVAFIANAQTKKPYNNLIITEARITGAVDNYVEITNMGNETIDLADFEIAKITPWPNNGDNWLPFTNDHFRLYDPRMYPKNSPLLEKRYLAAGKSYLIVLGNDFEPENWFRDPLHNSQRVTKPEFFTLADLVLHRKEANSNKNDSITGIYQDGKLIEEKWQLLDMYWGYCGIFLRHHYINETTNQPDSMIIDQFNGNFETTTGTNHGNDIGYDVAGVSNATLNDILIRRYAVKQGITDFSSHEANLEAARLQFTKARGLDLNDSEWFPVPVPGGQEAWKAVFWTAGNQVDQKFDATTLVSKTGKVKVDLANMTITVPWGIRCNDSLMYQFVRKPGLAWHYDLSTASQEDSATISVTKGDQLTLYVCGSNSEIKKFTLDVLPPTPDDNIVIPKNGFDYSLKRYGQWIDAYNSGWGRAGLEVTDKVKSMDTIRGLNFATRIDTLYKYLEKAPKASWKVIFKGGIDRPDLQTGDILRVTSENGKPKDYFIKLFPFRAEANADLSSITWPDIPGSFKGDIAKSYGWAGDTIPGFNPSNKSYVVRIPADYDGIPALAFTKQQLDSKVTVKRATTLAGSQEERTVYFTVVAEDDSTKSEYTVRFEKEKDPVNVQPWFGEPFISQWVYQDDWANCYLEIANPGTEPLDLSHYMFIFSWGSEKDSWDWNNANTEFSNAYLKYVPGKKWVDEADWQVQPRMLLPDLSTNSIVYPGDVFVMANVNQNRYGSIYDPYYKEIDIEFMKNPWGVNAGNNVLNNWMGSWGGSYFMYKILNDSVINGIKPATDRRDFKLIESLGNNSDGSAFNIGGTGVDAIQSYYRKPSVYKPNPEIKGSYGTNTDDSEWYMRNSAYFIQLNYGWPDQIVKILDGIGSHVMDEVTIYRSTVSSKVYKVSPGYSHQETIKGLTTGTTVTGFYANIIKANALQTLKVKSATSGLVIPDANAISKGDSLIVLSADSTNTSKYILDVTASGLSTDALLTSLTYTIKVAGTTGTIGGFPQGTLLKTVFAGVTVPAGATMTMTDANDAYMTLTKLNYDSLYVNVVATDAVYFEVIAENGTSRVLYQLTPTSNPGDAYVTSDVYSVDQFASLIQFVPNGTSVHSLLSNVTPAPGATLTVYDKAGFVRTSGDIYKDDKLMVTSADGKATKAYYFSMLNFNANPYLAYVISDEYQVDQIKYNIVGPKTNTSLSEFEAKLYPSFGATLKVLDKNGVAITGNLSQGAKLVVTAIDGMTTATYNIEVQFPDAVIAPVAETIRMYPNPTTDKVIINGLAKGNRVRVINSVGVTLRDVTVVNSIEYVSLSAQPAGIYIFVISSGDQNINIQKIVKK